MVQAEAFPVAAVSIESVSIATMNILEETVRRHIDVALVPAPAPVPLRCDPGTTMTGHVMDTTVIATITPGEIANANANVTQT